MKNELPRTELQHFEALSPPERARLRKLFLSFGIPSRHYDTVESAVKFTEDFETLDKESPLPF